MSKYCPHCNARVEYIKTGELDYFHDEGDGPMLFDRYGYFCTDKDCSFYGEELDEDPMDNPSLLSLPFQLSL